MASITINSADVIQACEKVLKALKEKNNIFWWIAYNQQIKFNKKVHIDRIKNLAKFSEKYGLYSLSIDHNDFALIGEYLTLPE